MKKQPPAKAVGLSPLIKQVRSLVHSARRAAAASVNSLQVLTNFEIGRLIVEHEQKGDRRAEYGESTIIALAGNLTAEFGRGFSKRNLELIRKFYLEWKDPFPGKAQTLSALFPSPAKAQTLSALLPSGKIPQTVSAESSEVKNTQTLSGRLSEGKQAKGISETPSRKFPLSWSHYVFLMGIDNPQERSFYEIESAKENWSLRQLRRQYDSSLYERLALSRDKGKVRQLAEKGHLIEEPADLLKEPFVLEFLGLDERPGYSEGDIESAIIDKLQMFLLEMGKGYLFEARQKRFTFDEEHYFVDLVFYNRLLRCYVLIDLKIGKLTHQDLGQMQMYVNHFDRNVKLDDEHPTVGIVLCKRKRDAIVELTLPKEANIFASEYKLYLPTKDELRMRLMEWTFEAEGVE